MVKDTSQTRMNTARTYKVELQLFLLGLLIAGLDIPKHGEPAYPLESQGDGWTATNEHSDKNSTQLSKTN